MRSPRPLVREAPAAHAAPGRSLHPRMGARRVEVARDVRRQRRRRVNVALALVCAGVWSLVGLRSSLLDVDRVQVDGAQRSSDAGVRAAAGIAPGAPMVGIDLEGGTEAVAALPWADDVRIERLWPGTVRIVVSERTPVAAVPTGPVWARVDVEGRVLDRVDSPRGLVVLEGRRDVDPGDTLSAEARATLATLAGLPVALAPEVGGAARDERGLVLALEGGWTVVLGDGSALVAKAGAASAVRDAANPTQGCVIDVRVPSAPVLTPGGRCA